MDELEEDIQTRGDRRLHDRSRLIVDVFFDGKEGTGIASTKDLSAGGLYMNTQSNLPEGSSLMIRIPLGDEQIIANAEVVYNDGHGVGLRFQDLPDADRARIEREIGNS